METELKEPGADLSAWGHLWSAYEGGALQNPLSYTGIGGCLSMEAYSQFCGCNCLFEESTV